MTDAQSTRTIQDSIDTIANWAVRGTIRQFYNEMQARLIDDPDYHAELQGNTVVFVHETKQGGFLGIGGRKVSETALEVHKDEEGEVTIPSEPMDEEFVQKLALTLEREKH